MKCPYCLENFHSNSGWAYQQIGNDHQQQIWTAQSINCPGCKKLIVMMQKQNGLPQLVLPRAVSRSPLGAEVTDPYRSDYLEACAVFPDSTKASAALSRRTLQLLLRDIAKVKHSDLSKVIQEVLDAGKLPSHLAEAIDAVRNIGNFAAHPIKSTNTGEVVDVEPGEAEWLLDVLEGLFDFYFTQPAILKKKKEALNKKLAEAGKPPMK